jgi:phage recombination protein Bet
MNKKQEVAKIPEQKKQSILAKMGARFSVDGAVLQKTLMETMFKGATDSQCVALLIVSDQYGLNPFTKEIYAFPGKGGGIVPLVGIDGWLRIINENHQFDGMTTEDSEDSCTCTIYRKDRTHPIIVTEYLDECYRETEPWKKAPKRMLRHKAIIQCGRVAFGFAGIHDEDEGKTISEAEYTEVKPPIEMPKEIAAPKAEERQPGDDNEPLPGSLPLDDAESGTKHGF